MTPSAEILKAEARGRWLDILRAAGLPENCLAGEKGPCPKCGGTDRFTAFKDVAETGGVLCRKCHRERNYDGIATIQWWNDCSFQEALAILSERLGHCRSNPRAGDSKPNIVGTYDYRDENGDTVFQVVRYEPKTFKQRRPRGDEGWEWSVKGVPVLPYRLPELMEEMTQRVFVVEGEKDADALSKIGVLATCNAGGAGKWTKDHSAFLGDRTVIVLPDNDEPGRNHARAVAGSLEGVARSTLILQLPGLPEKGDVSDWLAAGGTKEELMSLADAAIASVPHAGLTWPEIASLTAVDVPTFPTTALPQALRQWVEEESYATQTPADLAALLALAVCSSCIARRVKVEVRDGFSEPTNLFVVVLLEPGNRKSAVFSHALAPLRELETELIEAARPEVAKARSVRRQDEARLKILEKLAASKGETKACHEAGELAADLAKQPEPAEPRLIVDDATTERVGMLLEEQGGRIASFSPEGGVFDLLAGLYSKNGLANFNVYLQGHSGDDLTTDRVGRKSVRISQPALTCGYAIQPAVMEAIVKLPAFRGRGLLGRFLYAIPRSWLGQRKIAPPPVSEATGAAYRDLVRTMAEVQEDRVLCLSEDAEKCLLAWEAEVEAMLGDGGALEDIRDWGAKLVGATVRLAGVLHCSEHKTPFIDGLTMANAIEIGRYLIPHADAALNMMLLGEESTASNERYILRWIGRHACREFTRREAQQHGKRRFQRAEDIDAPLAELERRGYIRQRGTESGGPGRPPSPVYEVNPGFFAKETVSRVEAPANSLFVPLTAAPEAERGGFENIESAFLDQETPDRMQVII